MNFTSCPVPAQDPGVAACALLLAPLSSEPHKRLLGREWGREHRPGLRETCFWGPSTPLPFPTCVKRALASSLEFSI